MTMQRPRHWSTGAVGRGQPTTSVADKGNRADLKLLAKLEASLVDSERMVERQLVLIAEMHAGGSPTTEAAKSLARLKATVIERRLQRDAFASTSRAADDARPASC